MTNNKRELSLDNSFRKIKKAVRKRIIILFFVLILLLPFIISRTQQYIFALNNIGKIENTSKKVASSTKESIHYFYNPKIETTLDEDTPPKLPSLVSIVCNDTNTIKVCKEGPPTCDYSVIQDAVDAASPYPTYTCIKVAKGIYSDVFQHPGSGEKQIIYIEKKNVYLFGGYDTDFIEPPNPADNPTILAVPDDPQFDGARAVTINGLIPEDLVTPTLQYFTITGGRALRGGGIKNEYSNTQLYDLKIENNYATEEGGGVYIYMLNMGGQPGIYRCIFKNNTAGTLGGGLYTMMVSPNLADNVYLNNYANVKGGAVMSEVGLPFSIHETYNNNSDPQGRTFYNGGATHGKWVDVIIANSTTGIWNGGGGQPRIWGYLMVYNVQNPVGYCGGGCPPFIFYDHVEQNPLIGNPNFQQDGYHIGSNSEAIGKADIRLEYCINYNDIDNQVRPTPCAVGADEYFSPTPTPTFTPAPTRTPTPTLFLTSTPTPTPNCYAMCSNNYQCSEGLVCGTKWCPQGKTCINVLRCYNPLCPNDSTCKCDTSYLSPTPTSTPTPK